MGVAEPEGSAWENVFNQMLDFKQGGRLRPAGKSTDLILWIFVVLSQNLKDQLVKGAA